MNEYNGVDIKNIIAEDTFRMVFAIGNHSYNDYEGLKLLAKRIVDLEKDSIPIIIDSLSDLDLYAIEKNNPLSSLGYNKRVHDFCSLICAFKDCGYVLESNIYSAYLMKIRGNLIVKQGRGLDIMIHNPMKFNYTYSKEGISYNKHLTAIDKINGIELCNLMFYLGSKNYKNSESVLKHGNYIKDKNAVKILK